MAMVGMLVFMSLLGLCIDISHMYLVSAELQNAADAAALAGASALDSSAGGITKAVDRAIAAMNKYELNKTGTGLARADVRFAVNMSSFSGGGTGVSEATAAASPGNIRFVMVTIPNKSINVLFARIVLGSGTVDMTKQAVAGQSVAINQYCDLAPLCAVYDDLNGGQLDVNPECPNKVDFTQGCTYTIRAGPKKGVSPGNYQILAIGGSGGSSVRDDLAKADGDCYVLGDEVLTKPGVTAGPVRQGLNTRFDDYNGGLSYTTAPPDTNIKEGITYAQYKSGLSQYQQAPSHTGVPNRRILIVPIVALSEFDNGRDTVHIGKVSAFFMQNKVPNGNGGDIQAEYVGPWVPVGNGGYNPGGAPGNPQLTVSVLYK